MPQDKAERLHFTQSYADGEGAGWAELPYWQWDVEQSGCGLCSMTMCVDLLTGQELTPADVLALYQRDGMDKCARSLVGGRNLCPKLNEYNERTFGVRASDLERSVDAFAEALAQGDVIWASSADRQGTHPWHFADGTQQPLDETGMQHHHGHIVCIWRHEDGAFLVKDPIGPRRLCNNVRYTDEQMALWLAGNDHQQYRVTLASGATA